MPQQNTRSLCCPPVDDPGPDRRLRRGQPARAGRRPVPAGLARPPDRSRRPPGRRAAAARAAALRVRALAERRGASAADGVAAPAGRGRQDDQAAAAWPATVRCAGRRLAKAAPSALDSAMARFRRTAGVEVTCPVCRLRASGVRPRRIKGTLESTDPGVDRAVTQIHEGREPGLVSANQGRGAWPLVFTCPLVRIPVVGGGEPSRTDLVREGPEWAAAFRCRLQPPRT